MRTILSMFRHEWLPFSNLQCYQQSSLFGPLFVIFKCWEIFNIHKVYTGPASVSLLSEKARLPIHYPMIRQLLQYLITFLSFIPFQVSFHWTFVKIHRIRAMKQTLYACMRVKRRNLLSTPPPKEKNMRRFLKTSVRFISGTCLTDHSGINAKVAEKR